MKRHPVCACSVAVALGVTVGLGALPAGPAAADENLPVIEDRADPKVASALPEFGPPQARQVTGGDPHESIGAVRVRLTEASGAVSAAKAVAEAAARRAEYARLQLEEAQRQHQESVAELERARQHVSSLAGTAFCPGPHVSEVPSPGEASGEPAAQEPGYLDLLAAQREQVVASAAEAEAGERVRVRTAVLAAAEVERDESERRYQAAQSEERRVQERLAELDAARGRRVTSSRAAPRSAPPARSVLSMPVVGRKSSDYGHRLNPYSRQWRFHAGVDIAAPGGTPIRAAADGTVTRAGWSGGYGNYTCLAHREGLSTCYAHQSRILVTPGQRVRRDEVIGRVGTTGASTGNHLHFEVRLNGSPTDPVAYLPAFD